MSEQAPSWLYSGNAAFVEAIYENYLQDSASVDKDWRAYFDSLQQGGQRGDVAHAPIREKFLRLARHPRQRVTTAAGGDASSAKQVAVLQLINAYRFRGHRQAELDPLKQYQRPHVPELEPAYHGLNESDLDTVFNTGSLAAADELTLREILDVVQTAYCRSIGAEYMHINETEQKRWLQHRLESEQARADFSPEQKRHIYDRVSAANALEEYLHNKYVGQKRFSLEGGDSLIPMLDEIVQRGGLHKVKEVVIGMAHRGRLNVLVNILGKMPSDLFSEFEGKNVNGDGSGDVKYHLGYSSNIMTDGGSVHLTLAFNPSHLEIIDPVVEGSVRARQERRNDHERDQVLPVLIHGDAAFAGQGVVMETFNLSQTRGYSTGGTVHIIINNQIGFTTSDPLDSRSTLYCTDVAKMIQAPILHVNGDDPEAVVLAAQIAFDFRTEFNKDIVIDMVCYRRHGHSEADEPAATQPIMYQKIRNHPKACKIYAEKLLTSNVLSNNDMAQLEKGYVASLEENKSVSAPLAEEVHTEFLINYEPFRGTRWDMPVDTTLTPDEIKHYTDLFTHTPEDFVLHATVDKIIAARKKMGLGEQPFDWGYAETLAYASLLDHGYPIRISGQDSGRGTFFHRHAIIHNQEDGATYLPLQHLREGQPNFLIINSILSEEAVLAFEFGYSSSEPNALVMWEAQFGDFANGAQVVFDQFISSSEAKWGRYCGLIVMLPHGYDGQGPEHSSARLERYLQLCAEDNMQVCFPSTAAQMFHMLRRQALRPYRKPLIVMSPKSLLRHKLSTSTLEDVTDRGFQLIIDEIDDLNRKKITRLLICSGKVYYDLLEARRNHHIEHIAIARIEQLYPFPKDQLSELIDEYPNVTEVVWVQEEPRNQGACAYLLESLHLFGSLNDNQQLIIVARPHSASPAVGYPSRHLEQQRKLVQEALDLDAEAMQRKSA
ncbi:MAG: 2-oxoglutarate dehydrogenase E1 component [Gammaproteobacteria bacterium]